MDGDARLDLSRQQRTGIPEVIYASGKSVELVLRLVHEVLTRTDNVVVSRPTPRMTSELEQMLGSDYAIQGSLSVGIKRKDCCIPRTGGNVGIVTAGSSDIPFAEEAGIIAHHMGADVHSAYDVGVAGLHRLVQPLRRMVEANVDAIVVAAGMDGALPSVIAGLVDIPVIGLPTSTGYGAGGKGIAALLSMLQTCAPGLAVVNIDNGIGAGSTAALIANRAAQARRR